MRLPHTIFVAFVCAALSSTTAFAASPGGVDTAFVESRYAEAANRIITRALSDSTAFERLAYMCDTFGPRLSGSKNLENALRWIEKTMKSDGLDNVRSEPVMVPHWVRGSESLVLLEPRRSGLLMLGLGGSIGTPPNGITAEAIVVRDFEELERRRDQARGKIVVYNPPWKGYGRTVQYRTRGAIEAAKAGAVASLIRSVTPVSLQTPHTGMMRYHDSIPKIPHAAITLEDAAMLERMHRRGQKIVLTLRMEAHTLPDAVSHNVLAELRGTEKPDEIIVMGGHIDSWDVGDGAMDDGGGCIAAWQAVKLLKELGLRPRRTIRVVMWTNEENGMRGGLEYFDAHKEEVSKHLLAIESDAGVFKPRGFGLSGNDTIRAVVKAVARLLNSIDAGEITDHGGGVDISPLMRAGVPGMGLRVHGEKYFWYHHSPADTVDKLDPHEMNLCVAALAVMAYVVADLPESWF